MLSLSISHFDPQRTLANRAGYDALRHGEIVVFEPDLSALVRRNGKALVVSAISIVRKRCSAPRPVITVSGSAKNSVYSITQFAFRVRRLKRLYQRSGASFFSERSQ